MSEMKVSVSQCMSVFVSSGVCDNRLKALKNNLQLSEEVPFIVVMEIVVHEILDEPKLKKLNYKFKTKKCE